jgi:3-phenylpropionate/trans-cinnamate dioxygenase ferredoxin component
MSDFVTVGRLADLPPGERLIAEVNNIEVVVFNIDGQLYAIEDNCTHAAAYLSDGVLDGYAITCPKHDGQFDVRTGAPLCAPVIIPVKRFAVRVEGDAVQVGGRLTGEQKSP